jgi:hypothetical protein
MKTKKERQLLFSITKDDFEIQVFCSGGKGGQNQNKVSTGVRIIHKDSGAVGESREERSQLQNKKIAFKRLTEHPKFKFWHTKIVHEILHGKSVDEIVDEMMVEENIKTEIKVNGKWVKVNNDYFKESHA